MISPCAVRSKSKSRLAMQNSRYSSSLICSSGFNVSLAGSACSGSVTWILKGYRTRGRLRRKNEPARDRCSGQCRRCHDECGGISEVLGHRARHERTAADEQIVERTEYADRG